MKKWFENDIPRPIPKWISRMSKEELERKISKIEKRHALSKEKKLRQDKVLA